MTDPLTSNKPTEPAGAGLSQSRPTNTGTDFDAFVDGLTLTGISKSGLNTRTLHGAQNQRTLYRNDSYTDEVANNIEELFIKLFCESNEDFMSPQLIDRMDLDRLLNETDATRKSKNIKQLCRLVKISIDAEATFDRNKRISINTEAQTILKDLGINNHRINLADPSRETDCANRLSSLVTNSLVSPDASGQVTINISDTTFKYIFYLCPSITPYLSRQEREDLYRALRKDLGTSTDLSMVVALEEAFGKDQLADILVKNLVNRTREIAVESAYLKDYTQNKDDLADLIRMRFRASHAGDFVEQCLDCMRADPGLNFEKMAEQVNVKITKKIEYDVLRQAIKLIERHDFDSSITQLRSSYGSISDPETKFGSTKTELIGQIKKVFKARLDAEDDEVKADKGYKEIIAALCDFTSNDALTGIITNLSIPEAERTFYVDALRRISAILKAKLEEIFGLKQGDISKGSTVVIAREIVDVAKEHRKAVEIFQSIFPRVTNLEHTCQEGMRRIDKIERIVNQARFLGKLIRGGGSVLLNLASIEDPRRSYLQAKDANIEDAAIIKTIYEHTGTINDLPVLRDEFPQTKDALARHPMLPVSKAGWLTRQNSSFGSALFRNLMDAYQLPNEEQTRILRELGALVGTRPTRRQFLAGTAMGVAATAAATLPFVFGTRESPLSELQGFSVKRLLEDLEAGKLEDRNSRQLKVLAKILKDPDLLPTKLKIKEQELNSQEIIVIRAPISRRISDPPYKNYGRPGTSAYYYNSEQFVENLRQGIEAADLSREHSSISETALQQIHNDFLKIRNSFNFLSNYDMDFVFPVFVNNPKTKKPMAVLIVDSDSLDNLSLPGSGSNADTIKRCSKGLGFLQKTLEIAWKVHQNNPKSKDPLHAAQENFTWDEYQKILSQKNLENAKNPIAEKLIKISQQ